MPAPLAANHPDRYAESGVSIDAGDELVARIAPLAGCHAPGVLGGLGGFAALYEPPLARFREPVLVSATDGVGTKLKLAVQLARHDAIGIDLVAMCVNDLIAHTAEPLYFLDYFACGALDVDVAEKVITGIARGCELAGCALTGGETAEMPGMYVGGEYDLAGFAVGIVEKSRLPNPARVRDGDVLLGLASSGAHANGFSLIRRLVNAADDDALNAVAPDNASPDAMIDASTASMPVATPTATLADALLAPTRIYVKSILHLAQRIDVIGVAHITGGGLLENPPRVLPEGAVAEIRRSAWQRPALFDWLQQRGQLSETEMLRTFNCGIGLVIVVRARECEKAVALLESQGETVFRLGQIRSGGKGKARVTIVD